MLEMHFTVKRITYATLYISMLLSCKEPGLDGPDTEIKKKLAGLAKWDSD